MTLRTLGFRVSTVSPRIQVSHQLWPLPPIISHPLSLSFRMRQWKKNYSNLMLRPFSCYSFLFSFERNLMLRSVVLMLCRCRLKSWLVRSPGWFWRGELICSYTSRQVCKSFTLQVSSYRVVRLQPRAKKARERLFIPSKSAFFHVNLFLSARSHEILDVSC
jgi:hypothetical protein